MRTVLVGPPELRERFRKAQSGAGLVIVAEGDTIAAVQTAALRVDAVVVLEAPPSSEVVTDAAVETLTRRELDVLELLAEGMSNKAIASRLQISDQTVKFHVASISGKLGASNRTEAVRRALRRGLLHV